MFTAAAISMLIKAASEWFYRYAADLHVAWVMQGKDEHLSKISTNTVTTAVNCV